MNMATELSRLVTYNAKPYFLTSEDRLWRGLARSCDKLNMLCLDYRWAYGRQICQDGGLLMGFPP